MTHISAYHRILLGTIFEAYDRVRAIPAEKWDDNLFNDPVTSRSNLSRHYGRMIPVQIRSILVLSQITNTCCWHCDQAMRLMNLLTCKCLIISTFGMPIALSPACTRSTNSDPKQRRMDIFQLIIESIRDHSYRRRSPSNVVMPLVSGGASDQWICGSSFLYCSMNDQTIINMSESTGTFPTVKPPGKTMAVTGQRKTATSNLVHSCGLRIL